MTVRKLKKYKKAVSAFVVSSLALAGLFVHIDPAVQGVIVGFVAQAFLVASVVLPRNAR